MQQLYIFNNVSDSARALAGVKAELAVEFDVYNGMVLAELVEQNRKGLLSGSMALLGLNEEVDDIGINDYARFVLAATCGCDLLPGKVAILGDGDLVDAYWPSEFLDTLECVEDVATLKDYDAVIVCDDVDDEVLEGYKGLILTPTTWVKDLITRSNPTMESLKAMLTLMGGNEVSGTWLLRRGRDVLKVVLDGEVMLQDQRLKRGYAIGGDLDISGVPVKALYWVLWFAANAEGGNTLAGRLAYLTEIFLDPGYGEIREGVAKLKYEYKLGLLKGHVDREKGVLDISIGNGGSAEVVAAAEALDAANIPYLPDHQAGGLVWGPGALGLGLAFSEDGDTVFGNIPHHRKKEKILNSFALDKASCDYVLIIDQ